MDYVPPPSGAHLNASRYRLLLELGRGGMGTVYLAVADGPAGFHKLKVVKYLRDELSEDPGFVQMFLEEARLAARLYHPNIVQTNDVGFDGKQFFLEMEYLEGQTLDAARRACGEDDVPLHLNLWVLSQALAGLHYAHQLKDLDGSPLNIVHRDVSPHNVLLTYDGNVKLLDFGIAKAADSSSETRTGVVKGKLTYMAPEQAARERVDRRADVFAVGVMLWQAITRQRLWSGLSEPEIYAKLARGEIPSAASLAPDTPAPLLEICGRATAYVAGDRYATAEEMRAAIEGYLDTTGLGVGPRTLAEFLEARFGAQRADARAQIEARQRGAAGAGIEVAVPRLRAAPPSPMPTRSAELSAANTVNGLGKDRAPRTSVGGRGASAAGPRARALPWALGLGLIGAGITVVIVARERQPPAETARSLPPPSVVGCTGHAECTKQNGEQPHLCRRGACVALETNECTVHADPADVTREDTVWIGAMFPLTGDAAAAYGRTAANTVELARRDFSTISGGVPTAPPSGHSRALGLVVCDDSKDSARVARHLVDDLAVPAVIGFYSSKEVIELSRSLFIPSGTLVIASLNTSSLISTIPHPEGSPRLVWRTAIGTMPAAEAASLVVSNLLEPQLVKAGVVATERPMRVALLRRGTSAGLGFSDELISRLQFNGKSVIGNGASFEQLAYGDPLGVEGTPNYEGVAAGIVRFRPHVVIHFGADEIVKPILGLVEERWPRSEPFRPRYLFASNLEGRELLAFVGKNAELRRRFLGIAPPATTAANARLTLRYNEIFAEKVSTANSQAAPYDAFYLVAYAAAASGESQVTGAGMARAIARLQPPGKPIDVGPSRIFDALNALGAGVNVDLNGAMTTLDFDLRTGDAAADLVLVCLGVDAHGMAADSVESGLAYRASTKKLEGSLRCP